MKGIQIHTIYLIAASLLIYLISPAVSAGIFVGTISLILIRTFLTAAIRFKKVNFFIPILNLAKFSIIVVFLFGAIRWLKMDPILIAIGYTIVFAITIFELYLVGPKES